MLVLELIIVLLAIFLGAKIGGIGAGFAGGLGVLVLAIVGVKPGKIPFDVISIIMAVIIAISTMQIAGGMDYLVKKTEKMLRNNPKHITIIAPIVTYFITIFTGTGNICLSALPVISAVAKKQDIKPCRPLSTSVIAAQIAITASPVSAAVVYMSFLMEDQGITYIRLLMVMIPSTFMAVLTMSVIISICFNSKLSDDPIYRKRLCTGLIKADSEQKIFLKHYAKSSLWLFILGILCVVSYSIINSSIIGLVEVPIMNTTNSILSIMLSVAAITTILCRIKTDHILNSSIFKTGMNACICILGLAWLGDTFVQANLQWITKTTSNVVQEYPWLMIVIFFFASTLLYSQAATVKALMPIAIALNISNLIAVASFAAVSGLFILPTYPTLIAAVKIDETGTTSIGRCMFNHTFLIPGAIGITLSIIFSVLLGKIIL
ncbi:anaerobic C4-dicarboxylate transporter [Candidatus Profftia tarda]|uniref:C4-dicarboxylate transporter n=1 Tax=Candidatus Profftia tarda TaxID=1177216 RepID=A0A8E4EYK6_9ENTR|nr:anaerobic C4-dicarboxylate transporter [Candidatus Profftia tarda]CAD6511386.1 Anaerobic C4-dicarboxylate transporter DcuA [Candidatus Profftia tarda]